MKNVELLLIAMTVALTLRPEIGIAQTTIPKPPPSPPVETKDWYRPPPRHFDFMFDCQMFTEKKGVRPLTIAMKFKGIATWTDHPNDEHEWSLVDGKAEFPWAERDSTITLGNNTLRSFAEPWNDTRYVDIKKNGVDYTYRMKFGLNKFPNNWYFDDNDSSILVLSDNSARKIISIGSCKPKISEVNVK